MLRARTGSFAVAVAVLGAVLCVGAACVALMRRPVARDELPARELA
jgi:hypothetical protein